ncbi:MAG: hypothetical protein J2P28_04685 [Actinobacteria bacterium]|nr:hypothetical protein [Actinomycetota bacterium]
MAKLQTLVEAARLIDGEGENNDNDHCEDHVGEESQERRQACEPGEHIHPPINVPMVIGTEGRSMPDPPIVRRFATFVGNMAGLGIRAGTFPESAELLERSGGEAVGPARSLI